MGTRKSLSLLDRLKITHPSLSHPGRLVRLLRLIILILFKTADSLRNQLPMSDVIAS